LLSCASFIPGLNEIVGGTVTEPMQLVAFALTMRAFGYGMLSVHVCVLLLTISQGHSKCVCAHKGDSVLIRPVSMRSL